MRFFVRLIGFLCVAGGFVSLIVDGTRAIANGVWAATPLGDVVARAFPKTFPLIEPAVTRHVHPLLWDPVLSSLFKAPTFVVAMAFGFVVMALSRPPRQEIGFLTKR
jgi:hypothetical protein